MIGVESSHINLSKLNFYIIHSLPDVTLTYHKS